MIVNNYFGGVNNGKYYWIKKKVTIYQETVVNKALNNHIWFEEVVSIVII